MERLTDLPNIGREMARKLTAVGIGSPEALRALGAKEAFSRLKAAWPQVCLVHLYALEGAIRHREFHSLPEEKKRELRAFSDRLKGQGPSYPA